MRTPARFSSATVFKAAFSSLISSYTAPSRRSSNTAITPVTIMAAVGMRASRQFRLYMQNSTRQVWKMTSMMSMLT